jgi:RNA-directed DNA polymerase
MLIQKIDTLCDILHITQGKLNTILANIDGYYHEFKRPKYTNQNTPRVDKNGNPEYRILCNVSEPLKKLQTQINNYLVKNVQVANYDFGGIKKHDNILNAKMHQGNKYAFQTDMKNFYPNITNKIVYDMFVRVGFSCDVASVLTKLTTNKGHLPQGAPTSTTIANLVFVPTGNKILEITKIRHLTFTTFIDDITISGKKDFKELVPTFLNIIRNGGFKISINKTSYKSNPKDITGVKTLNNGLSTTEKFNRKFSGNLPPKVKKGMENYKNRIKKISSTPLHLIKQQIGN